MSDPSPPFFSDADLNALLSKCKRKGILLGGKLTDNFMIRVVQEMALTKEFPIFDGLDINEIKIFCIQKELLFAGFTGDEAIRVAFLVARRMKTFVEKEFSN